MPCVKWRKAESDVSIMRARSVSIRLTNAILAAVGYNFRRLIRWLRSLLHHHSLRVLDGECVPDCTRLRD